MQTKPPFKKLSSGSRSSYLLCCLLLLVGATALRGQAGGGAGPAPNADDLASQVIAMEENLSELARLQRARELTCTALNAGRFIQKLDDLAWLEFPVVLGDTISNVPIHIVFDNLRLYPDYAELEVIVQIQLPQRSNRATVNQLNGVNPSGGSSPPPASSETPRVCEQSSGGGGGAAGEYIDLYFGSPSLKFSHDGGIIGETLIGLYADYPIGTTDPSKFAFILNAWHEHGSGGNAQDLGTYVKIDCDGFVEMGVAADVLFSRDWIIPVDANDNPLSSGRVKGHIQTVVNDWQNLLVEIDLPNFAPTDFPEIAFNLSTAVFDFSDFRNSPNVVFPAAYAEQHLLPGNPNLWRGVYIKNLELSLPKQIKDKSCVASNPPPNPAPGSGSGRGTGMLLLDEHGSHAYGLAEMASQGRNFGPSPPEINLRPAEAQSELLLTEEDPLQQPLNSCRTKVGVNDLLIDGHGVTGSFYAENVLSLEQGNMDGWRYSLKDLEVELLCSRVYSFGFGGNITVPIQKEGQSFDYSAFINIPDRTYAFQVAIGQDYNFPVFKMAEVGILAGSYLDIQVRPNRFEPSAVLYGYAAVKAKLKSEEAALAEAPAAQDDSGQPADKLIFQAAKLNFNGLRLATQGTKLGLIEGGSIGLEMGLSLAGIPIPIANPTLTNVNGKLRLGFDINLNLMEQSDNGFAASTNVGIMGQFKNQEQTHQWQNAGVNVSSIYVNIQLPALKILGYAHIFDDHPIYGKGFQGALMVDVGPAESPIVSVELNAIFGKTTFKYWYVDGFVELEALSIPLIPGVLNINGFGGGAYYHMKMAGWDPYGGNAGQAGVTTSGVTYVPYQPTKLGVKASLAVKSPTETLDGVITLELVFSGTGLQEIMFYGKAEIVSPKISAALGKFSSGMQDRVKDLNLGRPQQQGKDASELASPNDEILATVFLRMNFEQGFEFQGTFGCKIDAAKGTIKASGKVDILISTPQNRWHFYVGGYSNNSIMAGDGSPLPPITAQINLGSGISATATVYFLLGNDIPGPPPLHPAAAAYFGINSATANNRASLGGQAAAGTGLALGAALVATIEGRTRSGGKYSKNHFRFELGAGFDVSLLKYANNTYCSLSGTSPHGHKGWRATGRIWAYANGYARYRGAGLNLSLGLFIEADLPKPTYLYVHVKFEIIGIGINLRVPIGEQCGAPYLN